MKPGHDPALPPTTPTRPPDADDEKKDRLAKALRKNLLRRKAAPRSQDKP